jgi:uncharacterized protein (DUF1778 family)
MAGRKKKPESERKTYMLRIRMTEEERKLLEEAAKARSLETSTWARSELVVLAKRISESERKTGTENRKGRSK